MLPPLWPHQAYGIEEIKRHIANGVKRILLVSPTGGGKSRIIRDLIVHYLIQMEWLSVVYTNRKMLVDQIEKGLKETGLEIGVRAAGRLDNRDRLLQVASIQTEYSRAIKRENYIKWELHPAKLVFIDEGHLNTGKMATSIVKKHLDAGAVVIYVTATPLDMPGVADVLVQAGVNTELRACNALLMAKHYGIEEPDLGSIKRTEITKDNDLSEEEQREVMGRVGEDGKPSLKLQSLYGRVLDEFQRLNPSHAPTILFAPGVPESRWFAQEFSRSGIAAGHIDGEEIWIPGQDGNDGLDVKSGRIEREQFLEMSRNGTLKVICNRFVLREGVDCPWLAHGIFATAFGSLQTYLQSGGRLLRYFPGLACVTIQDHGGNGWRHGSLNEDRRWHLDMDSRITAGIRADSIREGKDKEPFLCPQCKLMLRGLKCECGFTLDVRKKLRPVIQSDGELKLVPGDYYKPRRTLQRDDTQEKWDRIYWRMRQKGKSFTSAVGLFYTENGYFPPWTLKNMPKEAPRRWEKIIDVPQGELL